MCECTQMKFGKIPTKCLRVQMKHKMRVKQKIKQNANDTQLCTNVNKLSIKMCGNGHK